MFAADASPRWMVSEHSSTDTSTPTWSGQPRRWSCNRATPAAPATQPSPMSGIRFTSGRRPRRAAIRASSDGTAMPVTVVDMITSTSPASSPASCSAPATARAELHGDVDERVVGRREVCRARVVLEGQGEMPGRDLRAVVQPAEKRVVLLGHTHLGEQLGQLLLGVLVRRQDAMDRCHCRHRTNGTGRQLRSGRGRSGIARPPAGWGSAARGLLLACHPGADRGGHPDQRPDRGRRRAGGGRVVLLGLAVLTGQLSIGWSNDRIDCRSGTRRPAAATNRPRRAPCRCDCSTWPAWSRSPRPSASRSRWGGSAAIPALLGTAAGWAYNLGLKATVWSGLMYVICFGGLPAIAYLALPGNPATAVVGRDRWRASRPRRALRQRAARPAAGRGDRGARPAPSSRRPSLRLAMPLLFAGAAVVLVLGPPGSPSTAAWVALGRIVGVGGGRGLDRVAPSGSPFLFYAAIVIALLDVVLFVFVA